MRLRTCLSKWDSTVISQSLKLLRPYLTVIFQILYYFHSTSRLKKTLKENTKFEKFTKCTRLLNRLVSFIFSKNYSSRPGYRIKISIFCKNILFSSFLPYIWSFFEKNVGSDVILRGNSWKERAFRKWVCHWEADEITNKKMISSEI